MILAAYRTHAKPGGHAFRRPSPAEGRRALCREADSGIATLSNMLHFGIGVTARACMWRSAAHVTAAEPSRGAGRQAVSRVSNTN